MGFDKMSDAEFLALPANVQAAETRQIADRVRTKHTLVKQLADAILKETSLTLAQRLKTEQIKAQSEFFLGLADVAYGLAEQLDAKFAAEAAATATEDAAIERARNIA